MKVFDPQVSEYAVHTYRERIGEIEKEALEAMILGNDRVRAALAMGVNAIYSTMGLHLYAREGTVVSIAPDHWPKMRDANKPGRSALRHPTGRRKPKRRRFADAEEA